MVTQRNLAVIGAGPKAAAIAAKAYCLRQEGIPISVTIFERDEIGANWSGKNGYTDGVQRLCTPAERDLGFPYLPTFGQSVVERMQSLFSWNAFEVSEDAGNARYADWVNRGRRPPAHSDFGNYLRFALRRSSAPVNIARVTAVKNVRARWTIITKPKSAPALEYSGFHGVVFTGPGDAAQKFPRIADPRVFTGVDFWSRLRTVRTRLKNLKLPIVIIGGGGTAAAVTAWFVRSGLGDRQIILLNNQAMLFTRTTNFFENCLFDNEETWQALENKDRAAFTRRLNRGVVWETVTDLLTDAPQLTLMPGLANEIAYSIHRPGAHERDIVVRYKNAAGSAEINAGIVVDASGFDSWGFRSLLPAALADLMDTGAQRDGLTEKLNGDLSLPVKGWPRVHTPNLSESVGPGYLSLMVLGAMADRVLGPYYRDLTP